MQYEQHQLVSIAQRENNTKRGYLVVNPSQGKHIPVDPRTPLTLFHDLAQTLSYPNERLLVVGFAETATAIGAALAMALDCDLMQTTREVIPDVDYLFFTESHSHATEQKLIKTDLSAILPQIDRIIFAEDEVTTGNTILKIVRLIRQTFGQTVAFSVASLLNGMDEQAQERYAQEDIALHYLLKTDHSGFEAIANTHSLDGTALPVPPVTPCAIHTVPGLVNPRRHTTAKAYGAACVSLWEEVIKLHLSGRILVLGTEECMYPAMFLGAQLAKQGMEVKNHATTRSPIAVSAHADYPLHLRQQLPSVYDPQRVTYLYELAAYDQVLIVTDAPSDQTEGLYALCAALKNAGNSAIEIVRWVP